MSLNIVLLAVLGTVAFVAADHAGHGGEKEWTGKPWLGKWVHNTTDRTENWDAFIAAMPGPQQAHGKKVIHKFFKQGDHYHHCIMVKETGYRQDVDFKLGEEGKTTVNGTEATFKYTEDGQGLKLKVDVPSKSLVVENEYMPKGEELEVIYKQGGVVAKKFFKKLHAQDESSSAAPTVKA